jgi:tRNA (guanine37-N1)-methyltransferase
MPYYLKVEKKDAETRLHELAESGMLSREFRVISKAGKILIPINEKIPGAMELEDARPKSAPKSLESSLASRIGKELAEKAVLSFDIIGDIAIVEIPDELARYEKEIADSLLEVHRNVKVVAKKEGPMEGVFRTRRMSVICGENRTTTLYRENGVSMELDVAKVYFSPRLSFERGRIASEVKDGEKILALFAGVGPFPLAIAKKKKNCKIIAVELNPKGVEYLEKNILRNKAKNVTAILGDASEVVLSKYMDFADRVLMPLPKGGAGFLKAAYAGAKDGGIIHFYSFANKSDPFGIARQEVMHELGEDKAEIISERIVRPFSPSTVQVVLDLRVKKLKIQN